MTQTNPYAPPQALVADSAPGIQANGEPDGEVPGDAIAYAGDAYYAQLFRKMHAGGRIFYSFNVPAALFGMVWFFYRRQYLLGVLAFLAGTVVGLASLGVATLVVKNPAQTPLMVMLYALSGALIYRIVLGLFADQMYFRRAKAIAAKLRRQDPSGDLPASVIAAKGGTSAASATVGVVVNVVLSAISAVLRS